MVCTDNASKRKRAAMRVVVIGGVEYAVPVPMRGAPVVSASAAARTGTAKTQGSHQHTSEQLLRRAVEVIKGGQGHDSAEFAAVAHMLAAHLGVPRDACAVFAVLRRTEFATDQLACEHFNLELCTYRRWSQSIHHILAVWASESPPSERDTTCMRLYNQAIAEARQRLDHANICTELPTDQTSAHHT
jgi:hypothetical protein